MYTKILLLGGGGREHALGWKIAQSKRVTQLFIIPGNAGASEVGTNVDIQVNGFDAIKDFICTQKIDMVVAGLEDPLVNGIYDVLKNDPRAKDTVVIGSSREGVKLEGNKDFAKAFMQRYYIPTTRYHTFTDETLSEGLRFLETLEAPCVLKVDKLCTGKGVLILPTLAKAQRELKEVLGGMFGEASVRVVIEEYLSGVECSAFVLADGKHYQVLLEARGYKCIGEGDMGPNIGGMGSVPPVPLAGNDRTKKVEERIIQSAIEELSEEGVDYRGFIFFGLINVRGDPMMIEYSYRMSDPEAESAVLRLKSDVVDLSEGITEGNLGKRVITFDERATVCVMLVSGGYPQTYTKGYPISGFETAKDGIVLHSGTTVKDGQVITAGGRVLAVCLYGRDKGEIPNKNLAAAKKIDFQDVYFREDIGRNL